MSEEWKVGQKVQTPKGKGRIIAVQKDGSANYSLYRDNDGKLLPGWSGIMPSKRLLGGAKKGSSSFYEIEDNDPAADVITLERYMAGIVSYTSPPCMSCKETSTLEVDGEALAAWREGLEIQNAFPNLSNDEREVIKSGIHPQCWKDMFGDLDE